MQSVQRRTGHHVSAVLGEHGFHTSRLHCIELHRLQWFDSGAQRQLIDELTRYDGREARRVHDLHVRWSKQEQKCKADGE